MQILRTLYYAIGALGTTLMAVDVARHKLDKIGTICVVLDLVLVATWLAAKALIRN